MSVAAESNEENATGVDEVASDPKHDQLRAESLVAARERGGEGLRDLHLMLCLLVVDEVAVARAPGHVVDVAERVDDEDVHEGGQHEADGDRERKPPQVLDHGGQDGEELSVEDGADDGDEGGGEGGHEHEGVDGLHGVEGHYL